MSLRDDYIFSQRQATLLGETGKAANSYKMCGEFGKTNGFAARIFVMGMAALASPSGGGASVRTSGAERAFDESARARTEQSFFVPKDEIVSNDYDLSINKYKQTEYKPVEYPPTSEILANIKALEAEIGKELAELEEMLK